MDDYDKQNKHNNLIFENYILTVKDAASFLKFSTKTIYKMVDSGELPYKKTSKGIRFLLPELIRWMKGE